METVFHSHLVTALGWTFIHSLWQGLIAVIILLLIFKLFNVHKSALRYWLSASALLVFVIAAVITFIFLNGPAGAQSSATDFIDRGLTALNLPSFVTSGVRHEANIDYLPYFMMLWLAGSLIFMVRFLFGIWRVQMLRTTSVQNVSDKWLVFLNRLQSRMGITKFISLMESPLITSPVVIGHLKPIILFPLGMLAGLPVEQIEAILIHELNHIKRHDYLINIVQSFVEVVFYFNPFVWFISRTIRVERELACDDQTLGLGIAARLYAHTLADIYEYQLSTPRMSMTLATPEKFTLKRIQRLMKTRKNNNPDNKALPGVLLAGAVFALLYAGQLISNTAVAEQGNLLQGPATSLSHNGQEGPPVNDFILPQLTKVTAASVVAVRQPSPMVMHEAIMVPDTIDVDDFEQQKKEIETALKDLKSSDEWQKLQELSRDMAEMSETLMEELSPLINEQVMAAMAEVKMSEEMARKMSEMARQITAGIDHEAISEQVREAMQVHEAEMQMHMEQMEEVLHDIDLNLIHEQARIARITAEEAQINSRELREMAQEAEKLTRDAKVLAHQMKDFQTKVTDMLIDDGYIDSKDDIDQIEVEGGNFYLNGNKLRKKDQEKYLDLYNKYFDGDEFRWNIH